MESSFPPDEVRELKDGIALLGNDSFSLLAVYENDNLVAFIETWSLNDMTFIEHFAVKEESRGKGLGKEIMNQIISKHDRIVLEVEPPEAEATKRRIKFYEKLGFKLNNYPYIQPPLSKDKKPLPSLLMTYPKELSETEFIETRNKIHKIVYSLEKPFTELKL